MKIINPITNAIVKNARSGETIRSLAKKTGFAYSAVYKWVMILTDYKVIYLVKKGNKNIIKINKNNIYKKFIELDNAISMIEKDKVFWRIIKNIRLRIRFTKSTAVVIWTQGGYITGDFLDGIYFLEVHHKDLIEFRKFLNQHNISYYEDKTSYSEDKTSYSEDKTTHKKHQRQKAHKRTKKHERPLVYIIPKIIPKNKEFKIENKKGLPVIPLQELVNWCSKLQLDNILEQLNIVYGLGLKSKYSEIKTNV